MYANGSSAQHAKASVPVTTMSNATTGTLFDQLRVTAMHRSIMASGEALGAHALVHSIYFSAW